MKIYLLGLDPTKYNRVTINPTSSGLDDLFTLDCQISDEDRYKDVQKWKPVCRHCKVSFTLDSIVREEVSYLLKNLSISFKSSIARSLNIGFFLSPSRHLSFFNFIEIERKCCLLFELSEFNLSKDPSNQFSVMPASSFYSSSNSYLHGWLVNL